MGEVKFEYNSIENVLNAMQEAANSLEPSVPKNIASENNLDVVKELCVINGDLEQIFEQYKALLSKNALMVQSSVESMKETDEKLKSAISLNTLEW